MKQYIKVISVLLVLLMTVSVMVACNDDSSNKDDPGDSERESETKREVETEPELTPEDIEQLKADMSSSILNALEQTEQQTQPETETQPGQSGNQNPIIPDSGNPDYAGIVEGLLGSLGGLGNGDYDYSKIISEVLDQYIGSENTSDFLNGLIKSWIAGNMQSMIPGLPTPEAPTENQTEAPTEQAPTTGELPTEQETTEITIPGMTNPGNSLNALREYVAQKTAEAVADAIVERINEIANGTLHDSIYDSVYDAMTGNNDILSSIISESMPDFGLGQWGGLTQ